LKSTVESRYDDIVLCDTWSILSYIVGPINSPLLNHNIIILKFGRVGTSIHNWILLSLLCWHVSAAVGHPQVTKAQGRLYMVYKRRY